MKRTVAVNARGIYSSKILDLRNSLQPLNHKVLILSRNLRSKASVPELYVRLPEPINYPHHRRRLLLLADQA